MSVEVPKGKAALDPLSGLQAWDTPQGAPAWDPLRAVLGLQAPVGASCVHVCSWNQLTNACTGGAWSLFRGLAQVEPPQGVAPWDLVGAVVRADPPTAVSKYDLLQGLWF